MGRCFVLVEPQPRMYLYGVGSLAVHTIAMATNKKSFQKVNRIISL